MTPGSYPASSSNYSGPYINTPAIELQLSFKRRARVLDIFRKTFESINGVFTFK